MNLLITNANSYKAVVIATFIKQHYRSIRLIGLVRKPSGLIFHSKYFDKVVFLNNEIDNPKFVSEIQSVIQEYQVDILIPVDSRQIASWLKLKPRLSHCLDYYSDFDIFDKLNDKRTFAIICEQLDIPTPKSYFPKEVDTLTKKGRFVFKPTKSSSSKGVRYFEDVEQLKVYCTKNRTQEFVVQEYIAGNGGGVSFFAKAGEIKDFYLHRRILEYPVSGGSSTLRGNLNSMHNEAIINDAKKLAKHLNWSGFCMLEFKYNSESYSFIEANPRIWGSVKQGLVNGTNYFNELLGKIQLQVPTKEVVTYQTPLVFLSLFGYLLQGNLKMFLSVVKLFTSQPDINLLSDPGGYVGQIFI